MDDRRYRLVPSDNRIRGDIMIIREVLSDIRTYRDRDFEPQYFVVYAAAESRLNELQESLL